MNRVDRTSSLKVAICEIAGKLGETRDNLQIASRVSRNAARDGARLIVFAEGFLSGNAFLREKQDFLPAEIESFELLQDVSDKENITICIGFTAPLKGGFNNAFAIIQPNKEVVIQYKCTRSPMEPEFLVVYDDVSRKEFDVDGINVVISICSESADQRVEDAITLSNPDLILHPSAGYEEEHQPNKSLSLSLKCEREKFLSFVDAGAEKAAKRGIAEISANPLGFDGDIWWPGNSFAVSKNGDVLLWMKGELFSEQETVVEYGIVNIAF